MPDDARLLSDTTAVVTGGGDIGGAIVRGLAAHGAVVEVWDRSEGVLEHLAADGFSTRVVDVTARDDVGRVAADALGALGHVDTLVNSAAVATFASVADMTEEQWQRTLDVNLTGVFNVTQALLDHFFERGTGSVVNISSIGGLRGEPDFSNYCASKFGVIGFTQSLAREAGERGVRVNAVCPGAVESRMNTQTMARDARRLGCSVEEVERRIIERTPLRRLVRPSDVADAVVFLGSDLASCITGACIPVTGGVS